MISSLLLAGTSIRGFSIILSPINHKLQQAMSYSDVSKRRRIRDVDILSITSETPCRAVFLNRGIQDDDITVSSTSSYFSEPSENSSHSLHISDGDILPRLNRELSQPKFVQAYESKRVTFTTVEVRQYAVVMADYQDCSYPICLDWGHTKSHIMRIDDLDLAKPSSPCLLDAKDRLKRLLTMGFRSIELQSRERDRKMRLSQESKCQTKLDGVLLSPHAEWKERHLAPSKF